MAWRCRERYKDANNKWKSGNSFSPDDVLLVAKSANDRTPSRIIQKKQGIEYDKAVSAVYCKQTD